MGEGKGKKNKSCGLCGLRRKKKGNKSMLGKESKELKVEQMKVNEADREEVNGREEDEGNEPDFSKLQENVIEELREKEKLEDRNGNESEQSVITEQQEKVIKELKAYEEEELNEGKESEESVITEEQEKVIEELRAFEKEDEGLNNVEETEEKCVTKAEGSIHLGELSDGSTQSSEASSTPTPAATGETAFIPDASSSQPTSAASKVFVCGFWNSVTKKNQQNKNEKHGNEDSANSFEAAEKASTSKARRIRKSKLKSIKKEEHTRTNKNENNVNEGKEIQVEERKNVREVDVMLNEIDVLREEISKENEISLGEPVVEDDSSKTKAKAKRKNGKKGFSLTQIFTSNTEKKPEFIDEDIRIDVIENTNISREQFEERSIFEQNYVSIPYIEDTKTTEQVDPCKDFDLSINSNENPTKEINANSRAYNEDNAPIDIKKPSDIENSNDTKKSSNCESQNVKLSSLDSDKGTHMTTNRDDMTNGVSSWSLKTSDEKNIQEYVNDVSEPKKTFQMSAVQRESITTISDSDGERSRPISIFVVPPDNVAEEEVSLGVNWESASDIDASSQIASSDDDVHPETLVHLPSNDLHSADSIKNGRNGIIQVDEYDLSIRDLSTPLIHPEEEARLRQFLQTLHLTKPEEFDDDTSTSISETSPIHPTTDEEVVVYRHMTSASVAEPCYIPPKRCRFLDVITEENSDPSDTEKRPWENPELIRRNNDVEAIPDDWYGSEPETTSDEGGIDTSWRDGTKLEDADGVEVVYLSDSDESIKTLRENESVVPDKVSFPELVVVHAMDTKDILTQNHATMPIAQNLIRPLPGQRINTNKPSKVLVGEIKNNVATIPTYQESQINGHVLDHPNVHSTCNRKDKHFKAKVIAKDLACPTRVKHMETFPMDIYPIERQEKFVTPSLNNPIDQNPNLILEKFKVKNRPLKIPVVNEVKPNNIEQSNTVKLRPKKDKCHNPDELNCKNGAMDEIMAILNSTYDINRDILMGQQTNDTLRSKVQRSQTICETSERHFRGNNEDKHIFNGNSNYSSLNFKPSSSSWSKNNSENKQCEDISDYASSDKEVSSVVTPITSRRGSSSSATSQSTALFNPRQSPLSSEAGDKIENKFTKAYNPKSLTSLSKDVVTCLPHGDFFLRKIGLGNETSGDYSDGDRSTNERLASLPPSGISTRRSSFHELENIYLKSVGKEHSSLRPIYMASPPHSALASPPPNDDPWIGLPTSANRRLLVCLSPAQSKETLITTTKEATDMLDLHKKFVERRGYHEMTTRDTLYSPKSNRSKTPEYSTPDVIRLEPYEPQMEQIYTPELLREAADLLALKTYREIRFKNKKTESVEETAIKCDLEGKEVTSRWTEITADSAGLDSNRSAGTSRLLALLQDSAPTDTTAGEMQRSDKRSFKMGDTVQAFAGSYVSEWTANDERVESKTDVNENVVISENNSGRQFEAEQYRISKRGDIAIIHTKDDGNPPIKERRKSLPSVGVPALSPSGGELFREQMYNEYMNKVAERTERRQQKVIKISGRPASMYSKPEDVEKNLPNHLELEFMSKVKERMNKLGLPDEGEQTDEGEIPKHLQEFMELTSAPPADAEGNNAGVWSPGSTPEPTRKQFNFSASEQTTPTREEIDPIIPVWTPRSAQSSPTTERKAFRPVSFESPKLTRKNKDQQKTEVPKPPTDLPLVSDPPTQKETGTDSYSSFTSVTRESSSSSSGRLVTSHSENCLPRAQNPTITLLQKAREGQLPKGAQYLDQNKEENSGDLISNEITYTIKYDSDAEEKRPKKIIEIPAKKYQGIGPVAKEGVPIALRSEVQDENQQKWYKRMYDSLHKAERDSRYPYQSAGGYLSEPEPLAGYDSDYATLDRRRPRTLDTSSSTMPRTKFNAVKHGVDIYKNQPGRIEDYEPGHSSIADKETKQWWDEVMDIFDGQLEQNQKVSPRSQSYAPNSNSGKPFMTYALKESGYESDSTLVFKRRDETLQQLSPAEQKQAYRVIQRGGEVPLRGLQKPIPDKPKEPAVNRVPVPVRGSYPPLRRPESPHRYVESEVTIHYRSPVRSEEKAEWPEDELNRRQAEAMRRIYQEERRRKYLQELQDMYSRRHTDNFTPSQKSPIPLNRFDDFLDDLSPGRPRDRTPEPKLVARALYNFVGQSSRELTFRRGDIIYVRRQIDRNWYEGEHNAMIGLFPFNYVEIIPYDGIRTIPKRPTEGQARAKFNFQAQTHLELPLVKGELVLLTRRVDQNWFEGRIGNRKGIFPVSYVDVLVEPGERAASPVRVSTPTKPVASPAAHSLHMGNDTSHHYQPPRPVSYTSLPRQKTVVLKQPPVNQSLPLHIDTQNEPVPYRVLYNYKPQNEDELELMEGETVLVMEKCDDGWYVGSSRRTGCLGTFPGNYVERQL